MYQSHNWWFPDAEDHFPKMIGKNINNGGPAEYQQPVRLRSLAHVKTRRTALDVGANVGLWSRDLVNHFERVIAFEPVEIFRECLQRNVSGKNFFISPMALGDQDTQATMKIIPGNTGHTHIDPSSIGVGDTQVIKLDNLQLDQVDYIKIDCEGYEYRVLQGAEQTVKTCRPIVVIEQKPHAAYADQYGQYAAIELLQSWGMCKLDKVKDDWIMGW